MENFPEEVLTQEEKSASPSSLPNFIYVGIASALAFALGLIIGFVGRPIVLDEAPGQAVVQASPAEAVATGNSNSQQTDVDEAAGETTSATATPTLMEFVMSDARHVQGDADAPVTIIEFSDFK